MTRKYIIILITVLCAVTAVTSCADRESTAKRLAKEKIQESLYYPESYDLASFSLDSAYAPYDDADFYSLTMSLLSDEKAAEAAQSDVDMAESRYALWTGGPHDAYSSNERKQAGKALEKARATLSAIEARESETSARMKDFIGKGRRFIGYKADMSFRGKDNSGNVKMENLVIMYDKDMTKVTDIYYRDGEYQDYLDAVKLIKDSTDNKAKH